MLQDLHRCFTKYGHEGKQIEIKRRQENTQSNGLTMTLYYFKDI